MLDNALNECPVETHWFHVLADRSDQVSLISSIFHRFFGQIHVHLLDKAEIIFWTALLNVPF